MDYDILYILLFLLVLALPGAVFALTEWLIYRRRANHRFIAAAFPYLFIILFCTIFFGGRALLHSNRGIDTIGSVRKVPLPQQPWTLTLMNWDMHHAVLSHPDGSFVEGVTHVAQADSSGNTMLFLTSDLGIQDTLEDSVAKHESIQGYITAGDSSVVYTTDPPVNTDEMTNVENYYKQRYASLTDDWLFALFLIGTLLGILACVLLNRAVNKRK